MEGEIDLNRWPTLRITRKMHRRWRREELQRQKPTVSYVDRWKASCECASAALKQHPQLDLVEVDNEFSVECGILRCWEPPYRVYYLHKADEIMAHKVCKLVTTISNSAAFYDAIEVLWETLPHLLFYYAALDMWIYSDEQERPMHPYFEININNRDYRNNFINDGHLYLEGLFDGSTWSENAKF